MAILPLRELPRYRLADPSQDLRGLAVFDESGRTLGTIVELKVDTLTDHVVLAVLDNGHVLSPRKLRRDGTRAILRRGLYGDGAVPDGGGPS